MNIFNNLKNNKIFRQFSSALNVMLACEHSELPRASRNIMAILLNAADSTVSRFFAVIFGLVPKILVQRVTNQVNKVAILLHKYRFSQDCRNGLCVMSGNDWCWERVFSTCCKFFKRMYHPGHSANELAFKAKDDNKRVLQQGRSMIEMLGVLAIIAVLSVGGIAGYSKAMEKFKVNKLVEEYTNLMFGLMQHIDYFTPLRTEGEYQERYYLAETIQGLNLVPAGWQKHASGQGFMDSSGNMIYTYVRGNMITFDLQLGAIKPDDSGSYNIIQSFSNKLCFELFNNMLQPLHSSLYVAGIWKNKSAGVVYYGDKYCGAENKCLRAATLSDMHNLCNSCTVKKENCIVVWELDNT